jgi:phenylacetate-coenzyme A ligase PaaK-like adenylate-forming protein
MEVSVIDTRAIHGCLSREVFIPWVIHGPWTYNRRQLRAALVEARAGIRLWAHAAPDARRRWVLAELRAIVRWAGENVPYYRELFGKVGFDPRADFSFGDYRNLPALDKETIRSRSADLVAEGFSRDSMVANATGGSTGVPVRFWTDERSRAWSGAAVEWAFTHIGFRLGDRLGLIWGASVDPQMQPTSRARLVNWLAHRQPNDCFRLNDEILDHIHTRLTKYQPDFLRCYTSALTLLSRRLYARGEEPTYPRHGIITGAEKLDATQRAIIEAVFKVPVYESYGSRDCGLIAMQLSAGDRRLHVIGANVLIEPFDDPDPISGNEVVVTLLHRQGMPFLRYRIGDRARFSSGISEGPTEVLEEVTGRGLDHIHLPCGRLIHSVEFPHLFKDFDVCEYQVVQEADGNVRVLLVAGPYLTSGDLTRIERVLSDNLHGVSLVLSLVPSIERTAAGKLRPVISYYRPANM